MKREALGPNGRWAVAIAAAVVAGCGGGADSNGGGLATAVQLRSDKLEKVLEIRTVNNRADLISDGDALVELILPDRAALASLKVSLGGKDVTSAFAPRDDGRVLGFLTGLANGANLLEAQVGGGKKAQLAITNSPRSGPVLSGEQVKPFYCAQPTPQPVNGNTPATPASGLSGTPDANCSIATEYKLYYRTSAPCSNSGSTAMPDPVWAPQSHNSTSIPAQPTQAATACFKPYDPSAPKPADMAKATTDAGVEVDYIVRVERGTMNRGIYDIAVLFDPAQPWNALAPQRGWNGKLYFSFGASTGQPRRQVRPATTWVSLDEQIRRGYLVAMNSMTDSARNSNRVLMAETTMMMKEHVADSYGPIRYTVARGCSGGSINSNMNASIMPGLLDGVITDCTYPDSETTSMEVGDCVLLVEAYQNARMLNAWTTLGLNQEQVNARKAAINGHVDQTACHAWFNLFGSNGKAGLYFQRVVGATAATAADHITGVIRQSPTPTNNCELPNTAVYDPANPATANLPRCNAWSWAENIWGKVPGTNQARDTRDNVGVQYGLKALRDGVISAEEFVTLNEVIGGIDRDSTARAQRSTADPEALEIAYRSGIVMSGAQLAKTAIIDLRGWDESLLPANTPPGFFGATGIHHIWYSFAIRDRLAAESASRDAGNQAMWRFSRPTFPAPSALGIEALNVMDQWLTTLVTDTSAATLEQKVRDARPAAAADLCYLSTDPTQSVKVKDQAQCDADPYLKPSLSPRQVAGGPRAENILKCQLKPLSASDYGSAVFTPAQWARLAAVFPGGVCDWSKPGVGQQVAVTPLTFKAGPGGAPLGAAPVSEPSK
ncbi:hypothetical protein EZ313_09705 [Ramlibacter henchirensis]|uniref:DUF6351 domain-containing protein n=1 Tax=Ramlibacter henchirensis TaxID=204072 RepID=A0A4Z0C7J2_9BURK|nr:DUF6351 family protein [Ramlibacter henchirensis]TFZ06872.1 hypothetical protein EZ313_09705 [Ramlibacter henchirensis]